MNNVVVEVRGGVVQEVYAEEGTQIVLVDWEEYEENKSTFSAVEIKPLPLNLMPEEAEKLIAAKL